MKYLLIIVALTALTVGCYSSNRPKGWAEKEANNWAAALGFTETHVVCTYYENVLNEPMQTDCSINLGGKIYMLSCYYKENDKSYCTDRQ